MGLLKKSLPWFRVRWPSLPLLVLGALAASSSAASTSYAKREVAGVLLARGLLPASCTTQQDCTPGAAGSAGLRCDRIMVGQRPACLDTVGGLDPSVLDAD